MSDPTSMSPEHTLIAAIIATGLEIDGPDYITMPCGKAWVELAGLDPEACYRTANKWFPKNFAPLSFLDTWPHAVIPYAEVQVCHHLPEKPQARAKAYCRHYMNSRSWRENPRAKVSRAGDDT